MRQLLSRSSFNELIFSFAHQYNIEVSVLAAIVEVESRGQGFYTEPDLYSGKCVVRFEPDYFERFSGRKAYFLPRHISSREAKQMREYTGREAYEKALLDSPSAAMRATSFGLGQVMGFNYERAGFSSIKHFTDAMEISEYYQLKAMLQFIVSDNALLVAAQQSEMEIIAELYNGKNYKENKYHLKLESAYQRIKRTQSANIPG